MGTDRYARGGTGQAGKPWAAQPCLQGSGAHMLYTQQQEQEQEQRHFSEGLSVTLDRDSYILRELAVGAQDAGDQGVPP